MHFYGEKQKNVKMESETILIIFFSCSCDATSQLCMCILYHLNKIDNHNLFYLLVAIMDHCRHRRCLLLLLLQQYSRWAIIIYDYFVLSSLIFFIHRHQFTLPITCIFLLFFMFIFISFLLSLSLFRLPICHNTNNNK